jgi:hypothetical protein
MRCYFMSSGHIAGVEELPGLSDEEAVAKSRELFYERRLKFAYDGFEVWKLDRMIIQHPAVRADKPEGEVVPFPPAKSAGSG